MEISKQHLPTEPVPVDEIEKHVWEAIRKTINKFREQPYHFFSESDIVSYLWMCLYTGRFDTKTKDSRPVHLVHREYPTNFRYNKQSILASENPYLLAERLGSRGHYDLAVLDPNFVRQHTIDHIVNRNIRYLETRFDAEAEELLFAIEFKYVINRDSNWDKEIAQDNRKLEWARRHNVRHAVNLVFCNIDTPPAPTFQNVVQQGSTSINAVWIQSYYAGDKKIPQQVMANTDDALRNVGYL